MPRRRSATSPLLAVLAVAGIVALVVAVPATAASADEPEPLPYADHGHMVCNLSVAGLIAPEGIDPGTSGHSYVLWNYEAGFSVSFGCVGQMDPDVEDAELDRISVSLHDSHIEQYGVNGGEPQEAEPLITWCDVSDTGIDMPCTFEGPVNARLHSLATDENQFAFQGRFDFEPARPCKYPTGQISVAFECPSMPVEGVTGGGYPAVEGSALAYIRRSRVCIGADDASHTAFARDSCYALSDGHGSNEVTEDGEAVPTPLPDYDGPKPNSGSCKFTSWYLHDLDSGKEWSNSGVPLEIVFVAGHEYRLRVRFTGEPPSVRAQIRKDGEVLWQETKFDPTSPTVFEFNGSIPTSGSGRKAQLSVTCPTGDGDVTPEGQIPITDEDDDPTGGDRFEECMEAAGEEYELTSPGTWVRGIVMGVGCILEWAFVPHEPMEDRIDEFTSSSPAAEAASGIGSSADGMLAAMGSPPTGACAGPTVTIEQVDYSGQPFSLCEGWRAEVAGWAKVIAQLAIAVAVAFKAYRMVSTALFGAPTEVIYREGFWGDQGGEWS